MFCSCIASHSFLSLCDFKRMEIFTLERMGRFSNVWDVSRTYWTFLERMGRFSTYGTFTLYMRTTLREKWQKNWFQTSTIVIKNFILGVAVALCPLLVFLKIINNSQIKIQGQLSLFLFLLLVLFLLTQSQLLLIWKNLL